MTPGEISFFRGALNGFKRLVASAKVQATVGALTTSYFTLHYEAASLPPMQRCVYLVAFQTAVVVCLREIIKAWSAEDVADKSVPPAVPAQVPATQVNVGTGNTDTQTILPAADAAPAAQPQRPAPVPKPKPGRIQLS